MSHCEAVGLCAEPAHGDCRSFDRCACTVADVPDPDACPSERPLCDPTTFQCAACLADTDCPDLTRPLCDTFRGACAACLGSETCAAGMICDGSLGRCVECASNADCPIGVCDPIGHECVGCLGV